MFCDCRRCSESERPEFPDHQSNRSCSKYPQSWINTNHLPFPWWAFCWFIWLINLIACNSVINQSLAMARNKTTLTYSNSVFIQMHEPSIYEEANALPSIFYLIRDKLFIKVYNAPKTILTRTFQTDTRSPSLNRSRHGHKTSYNCLNLSRLEI